MFPRLLGNRLDKLRNFLRDGADCSENHLDDVAQFFNLADRVILNHLAALLDDIPDFSYKRFFTATLPVHHPVLCYKIVSTIQAARSSDSTFVSTPLQTPQ